MALRRISHGKDLIALAADLSLHLAEMIDLPTGRCAPGGGEPYGNGASRTSELPQ